MSGKIRSKAGETLSETLIALIIIALAASALMSLLGYSRRVLTKAKSAATEIYNAIEQVETAGSSAEDDTLTITMGSDTESHTVKVYTREGYSAYRP